MQGSISIFPYDSPFAAEARRSYLTGIDLIDANRKQSLLLGCDISFRNCILIVGQIRERKLRALLVGLLLVFIGNTAPTWADDLKGCRKDADGKLVGCEEILKLRKLWNDSVENCRKGTADAKISGCSQIIKSRKIYGKPISKVNLSLAHSNRGNAYFAKRQINWPSQTTAKLSSSTRGTPTPTTIEAMFTMANAKLILPSRTTARLSNSTRSTPAPTIIEAWSTV